MPKSDGYVSAEYLKKAAQQMASIKSHTHELMNIAPGDRLLDVGCGPGIDTLAMAKRLQGQGNVVGVDIDEDMLRQAQEAAAAAGLSGITEHRQGDVLDLPFDDGYFDAVRAERLFQVLPERYPATSVLNELLRVTKPGGRMVLADTDWGSASVDFADEQLERELMSFFARRLRPNGFAGRQFFRLCQQVGLKEINVDVFPMLQLDYTQTPFGEWLVGEAEKNNIASKQQLDDWQKQLQALNDEGLFFACVNFVVVSARNG